MRVSMLCLLALMALWGGCSLSLDPDRHQCDEPADCGAIFNAPAAAYTCVNNLCQTYRQCTDNAGCASTPGTPFCSAANKCVGCLAKTDCPGDTDTFDCIEGVCSDPAWGCLGQPDSRPPATQPTSTFTLKVADAVSMKPTMDPMTMAPLAVSAKACLDTLIDGSCTRAYGVPTTVAYDSTAGVVTLTGVQTNAPPHLRIVPPVDTDYLPLVYYSNRNPRDAETVSELRLVPRALLSLLETAPKQFVDTTKASVTIRTHDCEGKPRAGLKVSIQGGTPPGVVTAYIDTLAPRFDLNATTAQGSAGFFNLPPGDATTILITISPTKNITFQFKPQGNATSLIDVFPSIGR